MDLIALRRNQGAYARNLRRPPGPHPVRGAERRRLLVGAGRAVRAVAVLEAHPRLGLVAGATLVGEQDAPDPLNAVLAD